MHGELKATNHLNMYERRRTNCYAIRMQLVDQTKKNQPIYVTAMLLLILFAFQLTGCTLVPGSGISSNTFSLPKDALSLKPELEVSKIKITPEIISHLKLKAEKQEQKWPRELEHYKYKIGVGDVLSIVVWDHPELTAPFGSFNNVQDQGNVVREDGSIFYPFVGRVVVEGQTPRDVQEHLTEELSKFIERPQLDVRVVGFRSQRFFISGMVSTPGSFPVSNVPVRVVEALSLAGGLLPEADLYDVTLSRGTKSYEIPLFDILYNGETLGNIIMEHGDVLHVALNERRRVFVMGEVVKPSTIMMPARPMSLTQALADAGGIVETRADGRGVYVVRKSSYGELIDVYQLDMAEAWAMALANEFILAPSDIVYVSAAPITRWNRWVSNVLPSLQGLFNLDRVRSN